MTATRDPSPEEIRLACLEIQATRTEAERLKRLRSDLRPSRRLADGTMHDIGSDDYSGHHGTRAELQAMAPPPAGAKGTSGF